MLEKRTRALTGPEHYQQADRLLDEADAWLDADWGWKASLTSQERLARRDSDLAAAQVHATLALAAATAMPGTGDMSIADADAWQTACSASPVVDGGVRR